MCYEILKTRCRYPSIQRLQKRYSLWKSGKRDIFYSGSLNFVIYNFHGQTVHQESAAEGSCKKCESANWKWLKHIKTYCIIQCHEKALQRQLKQENRLQRAVFSRHWGRERPMMQPKALHFRHCCQRDQTKTKSSIWKTTWEWQLQQIL